jgi:hypothetical protein
LISLVFFGCSDMLLGAVMGRYWGRAAREAGEPREGIRADFLVSSLGSDSTEQRLPLAPTWDCSARFRAAVAERERAH